MRKLLLFGVLSLLMIGSNQAQTRISLKAGENELKLVNSERTGLSLFNSVSYIDVQLEKRTQGEYVELVMNKYGNSFNIGNPDLPVLNRLIEVPAGATVSVNVTSYDEVLLNLANYDINKLIAPAQESVSKSADPDKIPFEKNEHVYSTNALFSNPMVRYHEVGIMRGVRIGRIEINPLAYNPVTGDLKVFNNMKIEVTFQDADFAKTDLLKTKYNSPAFNGLLSGLLNYTPAESSKDLNINGVPMKFVIVSHRMFESTLAPFVVWKKKQGFNTILRFTDEAEVGNTSAAIKSYLQGLYTSATPENPAPSFVMLVGDNEQLPAFSGTTGSHVSDLYFVTYDGSSDRIPDVNIGRMSAKTVAHLEPLIQKTLLFEQFQMADPSYLANSLLVAGVDAGYATTYGNGALNYALHYHNAAHGINTTAIPYSQSSQSGVSQQIIQTVNTGIAWGNYTAHCGPSGWGNPSFTTSDIPSLNNDQKYGILVGNCCQSSQFNNDVCFAEAITRAANKGAIGYIGGTNSTYWSEDYWWATGFGTVVQYPAIADFGPGAYDALFHEHLPNDNVYSTTQGQIPIAGCLAVEESSSTRKLYYWEIYHLMGDPTLTPYIGPMPEMTPDYLATLPMGLNSFTMSNIPPKAYVALTDNGEIKFAGFADASGTIEITFDGFSVPTTADIVITSSFHRPFIGTLDVIPSDSPFVVYLGSTISDSQGNDNGMLDFDETVTLQVNLKNVGTVDATNVVAKLRSDSPYITIIDSVANCGNINAETEFLIENDFVIKAAKDIPDQTKVDFTIFATADGEEEPWITTFSLTANAPQLTSLKYEIAEIEGNGNGRIDPGETISVTVPIKNIGHAVGYPMTAILSANIIIVDIENDVAELAALAPEEVGNFVFTITTSENIPIGTPLDLTIHVNSDIFSFDASQSYSVGLSVEDFESGSFDAYGWVEGGNMPWTIVNTGAYEGTYCAKSGAISHSQKTSMSVTLDVSAPGEITFYRKVSSENTYDKLFFKINGETKGTWSGSQSWEQFSYEVPIGNHTFTWEYTKDGLVSSGEDCAWVDFIVFPGAAATPNTAPYFLDTFIPDAYCGEEYSADLCAIDPDGDQVSFIAESLPLWMTLRDLGDGTALLSGTPTNETAFPDEQIIVSANDGIFKTTKVKGIKVHGCTSIAENELSSGLSVYPNPSDGNSTIEYTLLQGGRVAIDILSLNGQVLKTVLNQPMTSGDHQTPISFEGLASGVYMVRLVAGEITNSVYVVVK